MKNADRLSLAEYCRAYEEQGLPDPTEEIRAFVHSQENRFNSVVGISKLLNLKIEEVISFVQSGANKSSPIRNLRC